MGMKRTNHFVATHEDIFPRDGFCEVVSA